MAAYIDGKSTREREEFHNNLALERAKNIKLPDWRPGVDPVGLRRHSVPDLARPGSWGPSRQCRLPGALPTGLGHACYCWA